MVLVVLSLSVGRVAAQGTAFTYQGQLASGGTAANGLYDFNFSLYDAATSGSQKGPSVTPTAVPVTNGWFMVTLDFGNVFPGDARWLDIWVKTNGAGSFTALSPRQELTPTPYAIMATSASNVLGTVPTAQLSGTVGNGQLANQSITVTAGTGLSGGGAVSLGGATTLNNTGVLSIAGNGDITTSAASGVITLGDTATSANTAGTIVKRDASGNFSAGSVTLGGNLNLPATTAGAGIIYSGGNSLLLANGGTSGNLIVGLQAGNTAMTGTENSAFGDQSLVDNTTGSDNTAIGIYSLYFNTAGTANTGVGEQALMSNHSGNDNTAVGDLALKLNISGSENVAVGGSAMASNTNGTDNTATGSYALYSNTNGTGNTANGDAALLNSTGNYNTAVGVSAGYTISSGSYNTALGAFAGQNLATGSNNIDLANLGQPLDNATIRIGTPGTQTNAFMAGIFNTAVSAGAPVYVDTAGHLGTSSASPVALLNGNDAFTGVVTLNNSLDSFTGNGGGLTGLNASQLTTGVVPILALGNAWTTAGNAGTTPGANFVGTTDNQPLELRTYNTRALRLDNTGGVPNLTVNPYANSIATYASTIAGGHGNQILAGASYSDIAGGYQNQIQAGAYYSVIAGGYQNQIQSQGSQAAVYGVIGGGFQNILGPWAWYSVVAGGYNNQVEYNANYVGILGGFQNVIGSNVSYSMIGGGTGNNLFYGDNGALIAGGQNNLIGNYADNSVIAGGAGNSIGDKWLGALGPGGSTGGTISGGIGNVVEGWLSLGEFTDPPATNATIAGGSYNQIYGASTGAAIGGGNGNSSVQGNYSVISGGQSNSIYAAYATVGGGVRNYASGSGAFIGGGGYDGSSVIPNTASGPGSAVVGGTQNQASASRSTVGGGHDNSASGWYATVPGGAWNVASGTGSFAAGQAAHATYDGSFVWNCDFANTLTTTGGSQFLARADGGFYFYTGTTGGATLASGSGSWTSMSDRNAKENFAAVDAESVLDKVAALPLSTWNYKEQDRSIRHLGPMAQDFKAAFGVGETDIGITTVDADGVALAAIQGLNQKLEQKQAEITELKQRLEKLERLINARNGGGE